LSSLSFQVIFDCLLGRKNPPYPLQIKFLG
jgi:hypothetical protein